MLFLFCRVLYVPVQAQTLTNPRFFGVPTPANLIPFLRLRKTRHIHFPMKHHVLAALFLFSASGAVALAQSVQPPANNENETPKEEVVEMSPFVVTSASDNGYQATITEAGSRLNSRLLDTSAAISVMTMEFMDDIGAINIDEALEYGLNTETHSENDDEGYRIRGIRSRNYGRNNFMRGIGPSDSYNADRATFSRGPNSILFGNADPSGIVNQSTKMAKPTRNSYSVSTRFNTEDAWRVTAGLNHVIVPKRVAIRVDGLDQNQKGFRKPAMDEWKAFYVAGTVVLVDQKNYNLTARFDYEQLHRTRNRARVDVITESVSYWKSQGSITAPNGNGVTGASTTPAGTTRLGSTNYLVKVDQSLEPVPVLNWRNTARGASAPGGILPASEELWPMEINSMGLTASLDDEKQRYRTIYLDQRIGKNLYLQLAYNDYTWEQYRSWSNSGFTELRVDVNEQLPSRGGSVDVNARVNPNVGQYYFEKNLRPQEYSRDESTFRASLTYELDLRELNPWLGLHRLVGSFDRRKTAYYVTNYREVNLTPLGGYSAALNSEENYIYRRHYVYRDKGILTVGPNLDPIAEGKGGINSGVAAIDVPTAEEMNADSLFGAIQSFWLKGRLVTIFGVRRDTTEAYERKLDSGYNPVTQQYTHATQSEMVRAPMDSDSGVITKSMGAVFHITKWLSLYYNQADNFSPSTTRRDINGDQIPVSVGQGQDAGIKYQLFGGKLSGSLGVYKNTKEHDAPTNLVSSTSGMGGLRDAIDDIWNSIGEPNNSKRRIGAGYGSFRYTRDYEAKGVELELVFNPTRNWRISLTGAYNQTTYAHLVPEMDVYLGKYMSEWRTKGDWPSPLGTINDILDQELIPSYNEVKAQEGDTAAFVRPWSGTLVTRYSFKTLPLLKGFSIGGALRFRDRRIIGFGRNADNTINRDITYYGGYLWQTDAFISYERSFFKKRIKWKSQLGVKNLLDNTDPQAGRARPDGIVDRYQLVQPRTFTWTNSFSF